MQEKLSYWQITEFSHEVGVKYQEKYGVPETVHFNTVGNWFKELEYKQIHYVERAAGKKVYDELDLNIAVFILKKRNEKWQLDPIMNLIGDNFEVRPFPEDDEERNLSTDPSELMFMMEQRFKKMEAKLKEQIDEEVEFKVSERLKEERLLIQQEVLKKLPAPESSEDIRTEIEHQLIEYLTSSQEQERQRLVLEIERLELKSQQVADEIKESIPKPIAGLTDAEKRAEKTDQLIAATRLRLRLEEEAMNAWRAKPESERTFKTGFFIKKSIEDSMKREEFVKNYMTEQLNKLENEEKK